jgi:hypothetical protein
MYTLFEHKNFTRQNISYILPTHALLNNEEYLFCCQHAKKLFFKSGPRISYIVYILG